MAENFLIKGNAGGRRFFVLEVYTVNERRWYKWQIIFLFKEMPAVSGRPSAVFSISPSTPFPQKKLPASHDK